MVETRGPIMSGLQPSMMMANVTQGFALACDESGLWALKAKVQGLKSAVYIWPSVSWRPWTKVQGYQPCPFKPDAHSLRVR